MSELGCSFFHKKLFGAALDFIPFGGTAKEIAKTLVGGKGHKNKASRMRDPSTTAKPISANKPASSACWDWTGSRWSWSCATDFGSPNHPEQRGLAGGGGGPCPGLMVRGPGGICIDLTPDKTTPAERSISQGQAVAGAFGMPAMVPQALQTVRMSCPEGMVLGRDDLCYPKQVLRRDSKFRKWRPGMRPILTGGERRGIAKAKRSINKARGAIGLQSLK